MPDPTNPPTPTDALLKALHEDFNVDSMTAAERIALIQVHATLAVADQLDALDSTLRDLHETLRGAR